MGTGDISPPTVMSLSSLAVSVLSSVTTHCLLPASFPAHQLSIVQLTFHKNQKLRSRDCSRKFPDPLELTILHLVTGGNNRIYQINYWNSMWHWIISLMIQHLNRLDYLEIVQQGIWQFSSADNARGNLTNKPQSNPLIFSVCSSNICFYTTNKKHAATSDWVWDISKEEFHFDTRLFLTWRWKLGELSLTQTPHLFSFLCNLHLRRSTVKYFYRRIPVSSQCHLMLSTNIVTFQFSGTFREGRGELQRGGAVGH